MNTRTIHLALVGCGALGSEFAGLLAASGQAAHVLLVDPDRLERHNLPRSHVFAAMAQQHGSAILGTPKAEALAAFFQNTRGQHWLSAPVAIADLGWQRLAAQDLLVSCTDSALSRAELAYAARVLRRPMLDGGVQASTPDGRVSFFPAAATAACYLCGMAEQTRADLLAYALSPSLSCTAGDAPALGPGTAPPPAVAHTAAALLGAVEAWQAGRLADDCAWSERLTESADGTGASERIALPLSRTCPFHEAFAGPLAIPPQQSFQQTLASFQSAGMGRLQELLFPWPLCLRAGCVRCKHVQITRHRIAAVRRHLSCDRCGHTGLWPLTTLEGVSAHSPAADRTPEELGLPADHLYLPRFAGENTWGTR